MRDFDKQMEMVLYHSDEGDVSVDAYIMNDSLWVTQKAMAELFGIDKSGISKHLKKIFESGELDEKVVVAKIATTSPHGAITGKTQDNVSMFEKSVNAFLEFRQYKVLKDNGRITHKQAIDKAYGEYEIFNRTQPIESDFDKVVKKMLEGKS